MSEQEIPKKLGRYEIIRELGKGAMGVVYEGRDPNIGRRVALKTARRDVLAASGMAAEMMERFLREARAAGALNHPNIITIYDTDEEDGTAWIAMEFIEGSDLREVLVERRGLDLSRLLEFGAQICDALEVAHRQGIVHRDIKPANILITREGSLKVADFGIAHVSDSTLTQDGALIGTPHYMSPEQFMGQNIDGRADLFSVGIILYELLTGEKPFSGEALSTVMHHVIKTMPVPPSELNLSIPQHVDFVLMKALAKRPQERYATAAAMAAALRECKKDKPDPAVLGVTNSTDGATVVSTADAATIAGPAVAPAAPPASEMAGDATLPSAAAPPPLAGDATMPSAAQPAPTADATMPSQVKPDALNATATPAAAPAAPAAKPDTAAMKRAAAILAGIAVLALVAYMVIAGRGGANPTAPTSEAEPVATADVPDAYFSKILVELRKGETNLGPVRALPGQMKDLPQFDNDPDVQCAVIDLGTGEEIAVQDLSRFATSIGWKQTPERLKLELRDGAGNFITSGEVIQEPETPGDECGTQYFVIPADE